MTMHTKPCLKNTIHDDLKAYLDGELPLLRSWVVQFHLNRCTQCREEIEVMEKIGNTLQTSSEEPSISSALKSRILESAPAAVSEGLSTEQAPGLPTRRSRTNWTYARDYALIGSLAMVVIAMTVTTLGKKPRTVFNSASNALNTTGAEGDDSSYDAATPAPPADFRSAPSYTRPENYKDQASKQSSGYPSEPNAGSAGADSLPSELRKVHKEARITVGVEQLEPSTDETIRIIKSMGGFIANNSLNTGDGGARVASIEARIPVGNFETALGQIGKQGVVKAKNITGEDITEKYSDALQANNVLGSELTVREAQLADALKRAEKKRRPGQVPWQQRAEVRQLRIQAAQAQARLDIYRKMSDLGSLSIELQEKVHVPGEGGFLDNIGQSGKDAMQTFQVAARVPVNCVIWILAYSPLWLPLLLGVRFLMMKTQRSGQ